MDPRLVRESENPYLNTTTHFVVLDPTARKAARTKTKKTRKKTTHKKAKTHTRSAPIEGEGRARGRAERLGGTSRRIGVSVSEAEYQWLERQATRASLSIAAYCRDRILA
jgi:hypothetical protein